MKSPALLVTAAGRFFYATAARLLALKFILSMSVSPKAAQHLMVMWAVSSAELPPTPTPPLNNLLILQ